MAASMLRSSGGRSSSSSSARWTRVPFVVQGAGGSGRRSRYENRNASGHSLNDEQELGDNDHGGAKLIGRRVTRGYDREADRFHGMKVDGILGGGFDAIGDQAQAVSVNE